MFLDKQIQILVFKLDDDGTFDAIGEVSQYESLIWPDEYCGVGKFELWAPITDDNSEMLKAGNILWTGGDNAAVIEIISSSVGDDGSKKLNVKGSTLEKLLGTRIVWGTYTGNDKNVSTIMYELVNQNCVNPSDSKRKIPFLECAVDAKLGAKTSYQQTGKEVIESLDVLAATAELGYSVLFKPKQKKLIFEVVEGVDRTVDQNVVDPVEFSTDLEDILSSQYYTNDEDVKTVALVQGEDSGTTRKSVVSGDNAGKGFARKELYVDARDLQSEVTSSSGGQTQLTPAQYNQVLDQRGKEKLDDNKVVETFEAQIRVFGDVQYVYGVDYKKGDKVTVRDKLLGVVVSARITAVQEEFDDEYNLVLTFGYAYPTLQQKLKNAAR